MRDAITGVLRLYWYLSIQTLPLFLNLHILPESPPCPTVLNKPFVAGAWQYLEQLSTLFVPITCLANFALNTILHSSL